MSEGQWKGSHLGAFEYFNGDAGNNISYALGEWHAYVRNEKIGLASHKEEARLLVETHLTLEKEESGA